MESYGQRHKDLISKKVPSTHVHVFPLNTKVDTDTKGEPQRFQMSTPPQDPLGLARPLPAVDFPMPDFRVPTRREERTIAQKNQSNLENAKDNMPYFDCT